jgi:hypothetical protein
VPPSGRRRDAPLLQRPRPPLDRSELIGLTGGPPATGVGWQRKARLPSSHAASRPNSTEPCGPGRAAP